MSTIEQLDQQFRDERNRLAREHNAKIAQLKAKSLQDNLVNYCKTHNNIAEQDLYEVANLFVKNANARRRVAGRGKKSKK